MGRAHCYEYPGFHMQAGSPVVVFCDLDDTVFEPHAFLVDAAANHRWGHLEREYVPLVFCSSRTRAEVELIQRELGISHPFICESGAAVFIPRRYFDCDVARAVDMAGYEVVEFGRPHAEVVALLHRAARRLGIEVVGFYDMSVEDLAVECDLTLLQARLAKLREYNEPFRMLDAKPGATTRLFRALRGEGLDCTSRGRYYHVGLTRYAPGLRLLQGLYRRVYGETITVAFGDHAGAAPLLRRADVSFVVQHDAVEQAARLLRDVPAARLIAASSIGAWTKAILESAASAAQRTRR
jgi:mannosyl-3-phosphoglycerate phosphatase